MENASPSPPHLGVQSVAMPEHKNSHGAIFGGWLMCQMDLAGTIVSRNYQEDAGAEDILTIKVSELVFEKPVYVGDVIECWVQITDLGKTSITTKISVNARRKSDNKLIENVAHGIFKYVNTKDGKPFAIMRKQ